MEHLKLFAKQYHYFYWTVVFTDIDPLLDNIKYLPEFKKTMKDIEIKFWDYHEQIKANLEEKDLL